MKIRLNSKEVEIPEHSTISTLKDLLGNNTAASAFAVNGKIVKGSHHSTFIIKEGDQILMIGAAYGG